MTKGLALFNYSRYTASGSPMLRACQLLTNIRSFKHSNLLPHSSVWPHPRRSAVLILLFIGHNGELRVLLTRRSKGLRSFSGHVSLPGGKADTDQETFEEVARREAEEEIGLPQDAKVLHEQFGMKIDRVSTQMPCYLSQTFLSVKPLVCFLHNETADSETPLDASRFFGKLNPGETSSIFSVPLNDMVSHLVPDRQGYKPEYTRRREHMPRWGGLRWPIRHYYYPVDNLNDVAWLNDIEDTSSADELPENPASRDLWGLTAKILYDLARIANDMVSSRDMEWDIGHEELIYGLHEFGGQLQAEKRSEWEIGMISHQNKFKYAEVIPGYYMERLKKVASKY